MRRLGLTVMTATALLLAGAMTAFACTNLATLNLSDTTAAAGATVDITGSSFASGEEARAVTIHWDSVDGPELATVQPDASGSIASTVEIPADAEPGQHVLIAQQMTESEGGHEAAGLSPAFGTPARASLRVGDPAPQDAAVQQASGSAPGADMSSGLLALLAIFGAAGVGLFAIGLGLFVREARRRSVPAPARRE